MVPVNLKMPIFPKSELFVSKEFYTNELKASGPQPYFYF